MDTSKATPELFAALAEAQAEVENATKGSNNPHFRSMYADLAEILNTVRPVFAAHGLCILQSTGFDGSTVSVTTAIAHKSGGVVTSTASCVPAKTDAQGIGSATTYLRRYSLAAMTGVAQEDDDGNAAAHSGKPTKIKPVAARPGTPNDGAWDGINATERQAIEACATVVGEYMESGDVAGALEHIERQGFTNEHKHALWTLLPSQTRTALKRKAA